MTDHASLTNTPDYWEQRYRDGNTRWDLGQAAPPFVSLLTAPGAPRPGQTAVLGSGRGYDVLLFAAYGFTVTGFDFAPSAIAAATALAQATGSYAHFLERDIFQLDREFPQAFDYVIEHTCFCAIPPETRPDYVRLVHSLLKPGGELIALFFTHSRSGGPPFGSNPAEIQRLFEPYFQIRSLVPVANSVPERQGEEHLGRLVVR